jgi:hypothetical protein
MTHVWQEIETSKNAMIAWRKSSAEETGLPNGSIDLATMASSFHRLTSTRRTTNFLAFYGRAARLADIVRQTAVRLCLEGSHADRQTPDLGTRQPGAPETLG